MTTNPPEEREWEKEFDRLVPPLKSEKEWMLEWEFVRKMDTKSGELTASEMMLATQSYQRLVCQRKILKSFIRQVEDKAEARGIERTIEEVRKSAKEHALPNKKCVECEDLIIRLQALTSDHAS